MVGTLAYNTIKLSDQRYKQTGWKTRKMHIP